MPPQCQGRRTTPKSAPLFFETGPRLHRNKPLSYLGIVQCTKQAEDLCADCLEREKSTAYQLVKRAGKYIPNQETMFHGRIGEPIPEWSRLQGGAWFSAQIAAGYTTHKEVPQVPVEMADTTPKKIVIRKRIVKKVSAAAPGPVPSPAPVPVPEPAAEPLKKPRAKKAVGKPVAAEPAYQQPEPELVVADVAPKKFQVKAPAAKAAPKPRQKKVVEAKPIVGIVEAAHMEDPTVIKVSVRKTEIDGRSLYVGPKDKVYDLKFKYLGRWNRRDDRVDTTYPDSDAGF